MEQPEDELAALLHQALAARLIDSYEEEGDIVTLHLNGLPISLRRAAALTLLQKLVGPPPQDGWGAA